MLFGVFDVFGWRILKSKKIRQVHEKLNEQFGFKKKLDYIFLENNKNRLYIAKKDFSNIELSKLRISSIGLYFGEIQDKGIRLSIEGSQLIGKDCVKNIFDVNEVEAKEWLRGYDIYRKINDAEFVIVRYKTDFLGCGKVTKEKILNFVPKNRRIKSSD